jgi:protein-S-isoprenylcysteine O-methyltransferase Ste14
LDSLWVAFGTYQFLSALRPGQNKIEEPPVYRMLRLLILITTFTLLLSPWLRIGPLARRFVPNYPGLEEAGLVITLFGLALVVWARRHLGKYWSDKIVIKVDHQLIRSGPYAHMRHPIYSGILLAVAGTALAVGEWRGVLALSLLFITYVVKAYKEDRLLAASFAEIFEEYRRHTGFLIPRFHV